MSLASLLLAALVAELNLTPLVDRAPALTAATLASFGHTTSITLGGPMTDFFEAANEDVYFVSDARFGFTGLHERDARLFRLHDGEIHEIALPYRCSLVAFVAQNDVRAIVRLDRTEADLRTGGDRATHRAYVRLDASGLHARATRGTATRVSANEENCALRDAGTARPEFVSEIGPDRGRTLMSAPMLLSLASANDVTVVGGGCRTTPSATLFWMIAYRGDDPGLTFARQGHGIPTELFATYPAQTSRDFLVFGARSRTMPTGYEYVILETDAHRSEAP